MILKINNVNHIHGFNKPFDPHFFLKMEKSKNNSIFGFFFITKDHPNVYQ